MNSRIKKSLVIVFFVALIAGAIFVSGCVDKTKTEQLTVALPLQPWSYWTVFYTAANQGYYAEEGLNVSFVYSQEGGFGVIKQVAAGNAQFGYANGDSLLVAKSQGIPVVSLYQDQHDSSWSIIAKKNFSDLKSLDGKTIAILAPNAPTHLVAKAILEKAAVNPNNITWVPVGAQAIVSTFMAGKADAIVGAELYELLLNKQKVSYNIWYARDYGINFGTSSIITNEDTRKNNPQLVEKFLRATKKGANYAVAHPEESVNAYVSNFNPSSNKEMELDLWNAWKNTMQTDKYPLGQFNKQQWETMQDTLFGMGAMKNKVDLGSVYTEEFLSKI